MDNIKKEKEKKRNLEMSRTNELTLKLFGLLDENGRNRKVSRQLYKVKKIRA